MSQNSLNKRLSLPALALVSASTLLRLTSAHASGYVIESFPVLEAIEATGGTLSDETKSWMKKWKGMNLDDSAYQFKELSGSTSINLKIQKIDASNPKGYKSLGSFVPRNGAANPNAEIGYFNLAAILGHDDIFRPAARYEGGPVVSQALKSLINATSMKGTQKLENRTRILGVISSGKPLLGCVKAKKDDTNMAFDGIADGSVGPTGGPKSSHPVIASLQGSKPQPKAGTEITLKTGYVGDALQLAREYSVLMVLDTIFQQWDRYSGGNVVISKDKDGHAHFYATDNGGADVTKTSSWTERNAAWFSRYDRGVIAKLKELNAFLKDPSKGFLGYTNAQTFIVDLGLYSEVAPADYVARISRNIQILLDHVAASESKNGKDAYLAD